MSSEKRNSFIVWFDIVASAVRVLERTPGRLGTTVKTLWGKVIIGEMIVLGTIMVWLLMWDRPGLNWFENCRD